MGGTGRSWAPLSRRGTSISFQPFPPYLPNPPYLMKSISRYVASGHFSWGIISSS
jgi:hypothetical protein